MKVTLEELRGLQKSLADRVEFLSANRNVDMDELNRLRSIGLRISMIFLSYSFEKDSKEIELGYSDEENAIAEEMEAYRVSQIHQRINTGSCLSCVENLADMAMDLVRQINEIVSGIKPGRNAILMNNINTKFAVASEFLTEVASLKDNPDKISVWKAEEISSAVTAASLMGRTKSEKKSAAARLNGKKGGRPRKNPLPESVAKKEENARKSKKSASIATKKTVAAKKSYAVAERRMVLPRGSKIAK